MVEATSLHASAAPVLGAKAISSVKHPSHRHGDSTGPTSIPPAHHAATLTTGIIMPGRCFPDVNRTDGSIRYTGDSHIVQYNRREAKRLANLWLTAVTQRVRHHFTIERKQGLHTYDLFPAYLERTEIDLPDMASDMADTHATKHCVHCKTAGHPSKWTVLCPHPDEIGGLTRMTLDRKNPRILLSPDNYKWMCLGGNIQKNQTDPWTYDVRNAAWRRWNQLPPDWRCT